MIRKTFESDIQQVKDEVLALGSMVEHAIISSVEALKKRDIKAAEKIIAEDKEINKKRFAIENQLMILIATQQPMAHDLRLLASTMEIISELERMGDYAKGIANINVRMADEKLLKPLIDIPRMAEKGASMLHRALTAFVHEDIETAKSLPIEDDEVDALYNQIYRELMIFVIEDPKNIERANWLLWVAHNLERVADRVTNICERTVFIATGEFGEIKSSDDEFWKNQNK
ncbi:MAG TPA: phosphate signaling complex protein PhoU [Anaerolineales bacterium]|nr:phosphate signaling complex protein PhoU [Anaerolineales bacterium]HNB40262.1 phosphate signaling complex protein PhoU [Anaerolineales bacterium]HND47292.1 phosphate signaling complex protein PhoU [Anaerolineales bacterium]HNE04781.1 phosphate signaling complex protein PhoU [Anaerolineales bacterium]HNF93194.1 phosphate signaling complex protein PhoU [Anaerolineales bacterium]